MANQPLTDPQRYITDDDASGRSFFCKDHAEAVKPAFFFAPDVPGRLAYTLDQLLPVLTVKDDLDVFKDSFENVPPHVRKGGMNIWYVDTPPLGDSPMHRTLSVDFDIQLVGELELTLENGETRLVKPGDITVQRGTTHKWRNPSETQWSRMISITLDAKYEVPAGATPDMYSQSG